MRFFAAGHYLEDPPMSHRDGLSPDDQHNHVAYPVEAEISHDTWPLNPIYRVSRILPGIADSSAPVTIARSH